MTTSETIRLILSNWRGLLMLAGFWLGGIVTVFFAVAIIYGGLSFLANAFVFDVLGFGH